MVEYADGVLYVGATRVSDWCLMLLAGVRGVCEGGVCKRRAAVPQDEHGLAVCRSLQVEPL